MTQSVMNPENYQVQLDEKAEALSAMFSEFDVPELEVFSSPAENYRMRAEFRVWHEDDEMYYVMFNQETKEKYRVDYFLPASRIINDLMPLLTEAVKESKILRHKMFQVDFLSLIHI